MPIVEINPVEPDDLTVARFDTDSGRAARMAADHLMARGFRHFGYCGHAGVSFSDSRCDTFSASLAESGFMTHIFNGPSSPRCPGETLEREAWREARPCAGGLAAVPSQTRGHHGMQRYAWLAGADRL